MKNNSKNTIAIKYVPPKDLRPGIWVTVLVAIVLILGVLIYEFAFDNDPATSDPVGMEANWQTYSPSPEKIPCSPLDDSGLERIRYCFFPKWKTVEFKYPPGWEYRENVQSNYDPGGFSYEHHVCFVGHNPQIAFSNIDDFIDCDVDFYVTKEIEEFKNIGDKFLEVLSVETNEPILGFKIGSFDSKELNTGFEGHKFKYVFMQVDHLVYLFALNKLTNDNLLNFQKILSTFKFIENTTSQAYNVSLYAYEKDGSHIFDGAVIAAIDKATGKIVSEQTADGDGKVTFNLPEGEYRFQPSPLRENRIVGKVDNVFIPLEENKPILMLLTEVGPSAFGAPVDTCEEKHQAIEEIFSIANYCETDADCQTVDVTSYPNFECFYEINKNYSTNILFQRLQDYSTGTCNDKPFNKLCPFKPEGRLVCVGGKGICARVK